MDIDETNISTELWFFLLAKQHFDSEKWNKKNLRWPMCLKLRKGECRFWLETTIRLTVIGWATITKFSLDEIIVCQKMCVSFESGKKERKIPAIKTNIQSQSHDTHTHTDSFFTLIEIRLLNIPVTLMSNCLCVHTHTSLNETNETERQNGRRQERN